jgi:hypothetical protein
MPPGGPPFEQRIQGSIGQKSGIHKVHSDVCGGDHIDPHWNALRHIRKLFGGEDVSGSRQTF